MDTNALLATGSIVESAEIASGTSNLADAALVQRVDSLLAQFRAAAADWTPDQEEATRRQVVKLLARRLGIARDVAVHPAILDERIEAPVFVIGFPRTGTSIIQALLAEDPANRGVEAWRTREPSPPPGQMPVAPWRHEASRRAIMHQLERCPGLMALHPYWDRWHDTLTEDEEILSLDFRNTYPTLLCDAPMLALMGEDPKPEASYAFLRLFMQHQQWRCGARRWVMKGVDHQRYLNALFATFPDARCLFPHREPGDFMPSNLAIAATVYDGMTSGALDRKTLGPAYLADFRARLDAMLADPMLDDPRISHMPFKRFIADPVGTLQTLYGEWGFDWSDTAGLAMRAWLDDPANASDRYGKHVYRFEPFGVDWTVESSAFAPYRKRFLQG